MILDSYNTIENESQGFYSDKGSKFISYAFPVRTEEDVKINIQVLRKKHHDARHHVYAFIIGHAQDFYRASDDGEPANSSGMPVLGQIRSFGLTNVQIIVVRYFGGTKLGVPGLINAYRSAAKDALDNAKVIEETVKEEFEVKCTYDEISFVMKCIKDSEALIKLQDFTDTCRIVFAIRLSLVEQVLNSLNQNHKLLIEKYNEYSVL